VTLGLFKAAGGLPNSVSANTVVPGPVEPLCPTDVDGNGTTDIDDLLTVINNWGAGKGNPGDVDGSGSVDIDDLLAVINGWGNC
jgi:hypothetical protein